MRSQFLACSVLGVASVVVPARGVAAAGDPVVMITIDATEIGRNLVKSVSTIQVKPGPLELRYCIWTPGNHNPSGPIENVINLLVQDCNGQRLHWDRDPTQVDRITLTVPEGCATVDVKLDYIASQPGPNSRSSDTYGRADLGVLNFNTVLLYPAHLDTQEVSVQPLLFIPRGWKAACALPFKTQDTSMGEAVMFLARPALPEIIDSPVIMGVHLSSTELERPEGVPKHVVHVVAPEPKHAEVPQFLVPQLEAMVRETVAIFGSFPRQSYRFLIACADGLGFGLEHSESTLIGFGKDGISSAVRDDLRAGGGKLLVIPHEYFHVWCGKLRAPEGLVTGDFTTPARTELLWVYEGLTAYYDTVLGARAGMINTEEFRQEILDLCVAMQMRTGRQWRSVEDTARAARFLRPRGVSWYEHRRGQDYYTEAALFWLEADAIIRSASAGQKSLDDFCRSFFAVKAGPVGAVATYNRADVVAALKELEAGTDWDALIRERLERPVASLDLAPLLKKVGYEIEWADSPTDLQKKQHASDDTINLRTSLGVRVAKDGTITEIVPGSPMDRAGARFTSKIVGVNGWVFSAERLREAVRESRERPSLELLTTFDDKFETLRLDYDQGPRVPRLKRIEGVPDVLEAVGRARAPAAAKKAE